MRKFGIAVTLGASALVAVAVLLVGVAPRFSGAADHLDAPAVAADGQTDINDVFAFQSPTTAANTVLIMTVNPLAGVLSPTTFSEDATYEFKIDNNGDDREDLTYKVTFSGAAAPQTVTLRCVPVSRCADGGGAVIAQGLTSVTIGVDGGGSLRAGLFDDPFFFDLASLVGFDFCMPTDPAVDFFAGRNVSGIVLEVPSSDLLDSSGPSIGVWARTTVPARGNKTTLVDRMGIPVINTVLIPAGSKDDFNAAKPRNDADFNADVEASLLFLSGLDGSGYTAGEAAFVRSLLLPDVLTLDTSSAAGFVPGLNGRQLADDVIDFELFVVTGGLGAVNMPVGTPVLDDDCVDANDVAFPGAFPYLAPAH